ncbi:archease [Burkholderia mayonis]|uniref:Archease n=1 Tax=Burkholderia mayonis TaxID=1385591 RepID=A0A1B4FU12_9BURK|nr:archease [Burkholderia mayonis]AOJ07168.1 archease [Burkholderia mayonis]KVE52569.1 archease [Burkholderia mayonis]
MTALWEHFQHDADVGVRGVGETLAQAYEQAALALTAIVANPASVRPLCAFEIACAETDRELLLVDWLNAIVYEMAVRKMLFSHFDVTLADDGLHAHIAGEPVDVARHRPAVEPKGATYTALRVERLDDGAWIAECVVDV